jgi:uncharacterized protein (DUF2141 family)
MKKTIILLAAAILFLTADLYPQADITRGNLTFTLTGFADNSGQVIVQFFRRDDKIPTDPYKEVSAKITNNEAVVIIENLPYGVYAAILVHDKNANGFIDHRLGIPAEPLAYTNNWKLTLFSGMPTFDKLKFSFSQLKDHIPIAFK